jgi:sterol desaturase/sphingolipid hydroxylase (fatty acid hydroxylase superfamily)
MNPNDPNQVIGPPQFIIPTVIVIGLLLGWLVAGAPGAGAAVATGIWLVIAYEYAHASAHLVAEPASGYGRMIRHLHMLHHYHNEKGNFGVTSPIADLIVGTYYSDATKVERCPTVRNLGYTPEEAKRRPWASHD